jgi:signal transduction histidine kinase
MLGAAGPWRVSVQTLHFHGLKMLDWNPHKLKVSVFIEAICQTLSIVAGIICLVQAVLFAVVWYFNREVRGTDLWGTSALLSGFAMLLLPLRSVIESVLLTQVLPTLLNLSSVMFFYAGAAAFMGRRAQFKWPALVSIPLFCGFLWFRLAVDLHTGRAICSSSLFILFLALGARELLREKRPGLLFSSRWIGCAAILLCLMLVCRAFAIVLWYPSGHVFDGAMPQLVNFSSAILWAISWTFGALMLLNQRQLLEIRSANHSHLLAQARVAEVEKEIIAERTIRQRLNLLRDLHDGVGGTTANLALLASTAHSVIPDSPGAGILHNIEHLAIEGNREVRLLMDLLEREHMFWPDLLQQLRAHADHLTRANHISLDWRMSGMHLAAPIIETSAAISMIRALKEALNNLARHSAASHARVSIRFGSRSLAVMIRDNGRGLSKPAGAGGRGLKNMHQRAAELGGRLRIRSSHGTRLHFVIPLPLVPPDVPRKHPISPLVSQASDGPPSIA